MSEWMTVRQAAKKLNMNEQAVRRLIRAGALPASSPGGRKTGYRIAASAAEAFMVSRAKGGQE